MTNPRLSASALALSLLFVAACSSPTNIADADDICDGKTDEACRSLMQDQCRRELTAFNEQQRTDKLEWRREHEAEQNTPAWTEGYRDLLGQQSDERKIFVADYREKCSSYTQPDDTEVLEEESLEDAAESSSSAEGA